jgi:hypothetical protein
MNIMGFLDKLKRAFSGEKEKTDEAKKNAAKVQKAANDSTERAKRAADKTSDATEDAAESLDETKKE